MIAVNALQKIGVNSMEDVKILIRICTAVCGIYLYFMAWIQVLQNDLTLYDGYDVLEKSFKILGKAFLLVHLIALLGAIVWAWI